MAPSRWGTFRKLHVHMICDGWGTKCELYNVLRAIMIFYYLYRYVLIHIIEYVQVPTTLDI